MIQGEPSNQVIQSAENPYNSTVSLSQEQIRRFETDGYLSLPEITTQDEVAWMREVYDRLFERKPGWNKGDFFDFAGTDEEGAPARLPQLLNPSCYEPTLAQTIFRANADAIARQLLGDKAKLIFEHAMMKQALNGGETAWHQDAAFYAKYTNYRAITIWMPLQPVDDLNGCMEFIPGSQRGALTAHRHVNDDPRIHGLEAVGVDGSLAIQCPLRAGGATIHGDKTLHHAGPNRSDKPRRAYALVYGLRGRQFILHEDHPWNQAGSTARERRLATSRGPAQQVTAKLKDIAKRILRS